MDVNRYAILFAIKKDWILELDNNFVELFGFEKKYLKKDIIDQINSKFRQNYFLKIYCNLADNKEDNEFLTNIFIKNNIGD